MKTKNKTRDLALIAILGALCGILMYLKFALPFVPFMEFDLTGIVEIVGGFAMGPIQAVGIILVKLLVKLITQGTSSAFTGEIQNFLLSCVYVLPAVLLYHHKKSKKNAIIGMVIGSVLCCIFAVFSNIYIIFPLYGMTTADFVTACKVMNPLVENTMTAILFGIVPFNLIKCGINSVVTVLIYKRVSPILHMSKKQRKEKLATEKGV